MSFVKRLTALESKVAAQEKEIAELKEQASVRPETFKVVISDLSASIIQKYFEEVSRRASESRKRDRLFREQIKADS